MCHSVTCWEWRSSSDSNGPGITARHHDNVSPVAGRYFIPIRFPDKRIRQENIALDWFNPHLVVPVHDGPGSCRMPRLIGLEAPIRVQGNNKTRGRQQKFPKNYFAFWIANEFISTPVPLWSHEIRGIVSGLGSLVGFVCRPRTEPRTADAFQFATHVQWSVAGPPVRPSRVPEKRSGEMR